ncbi:hypothetical protein VOLCADRAFT_86358 [Volvox carteri f. nagariensis]|uniref:PhoD-like phosphatase domain-containing protein n=1 Tax=Volvox carteri f. nagariensis TaxID=3068 RepID=D8TIK1_VOLCA|nr:uncharacterized protein VOLCADRAFT_86358 [Volvox carteri f. nagariensis]EFJ53258.1 hypothetical protein VOLCADRAFT_86358 [Volvox carteri f. nagariensis]|eukprot:XP_002946263.1 hypothetical protein VOLCADRAFT_86358 [Volvox carteri f. nagariensis]
MRKPAGQLLQALASVLSARTVELLLSRAIVILSRSRCGVDRVMVAPPGPHDAHIRENTCGCGALKTPSPSVGPFIRLRGYDADDGTWRATVLYGTTGGSADGAVSDADDAEAAGIIDLGGLEGDGGGDDGGKSGGVAVPSSTVFWRFSLTVGVLDTAAQWLEYWVEDEVAAEAERGPMYGGVDGGGDAWPCTPRRVYIPSRGEGWRWAFYSCAGFSLDVSAREQVDRFCGSFPLWSDLLSRHRQRPFSALVGGGDQLYNDDVWQVPALEAWLDLPHPEQRLAVPFTTQMATQALSYYVRHYCTHYMSEPVREAYATIPQVSTWDDHDIFDGWGSYPLQLHSCPVFSGLLQCARAAYLLFQHHTTAERAASDGLILTPGGGVHNVVALGPRQALVLPDQRGERTRFQVLPLESYADVFAALVRLPRSVRHVILVATVPLVYPHIVGSHRLMICFRGLYRSSFFRPLMAKTGVSSAIMNRFGGCPGPARPPRVSQISGDVHLCGVGKLHSWPRSPWKSPGGDWRYMQQIISSAIVNKPPPTCLVRVLQWSGRAGLLNRGTRSHLKHTFRDTATRNQLLNLRNWCEVEEDRTSGELVFTLRVEPELPRTAPAAGGGGADGGGGGRDGCLGGVLRCCRFTTTAKDNHQQQQQQQEGEEEGRGGAAVAAAPAGASVEQMTYGSSGGDLGSGTAAATTMATAAGKLDEVWQRAAAPGDVGSAGGGVLLSLPFTVTLREVSGNLDRTLARGPLRITTTTTTTTTTSTPSPHGTPVHGHGRDGGGGGGGGSGKGGVPHVSLWVGSAEFPLSAPRGPGSDLTPHSSPPRVRGTNSQSYGTAATAAVPILCHRIDSRTLQLTLGSVNHHQQQEPGEVAGGSGGGGGGGRGEGAMQSRAIPSPASTLLLVFPGDATDHDVSRTAAVLSDLASGRGQVTPEAPAGAAVYGTQPSPPQPPPPSPKPTTAGSPPGVLFHDTDPARSLGWKNNQPVRLTHLERVLPPPPPSGVLQQRSRVGGGLLAAAEEAAAEAAGTSGGDGDDDGGGGGRSLFGSRGAEAGSPGGTRLGRLRGLALGSVWGSVAVANLAYEKVTANWDKRLGPGADNFNFAIDLDRAAAEYGVALRTTLAAGNHVTLGLAVHYQVASGQEAGGYWDNNEGTNYTFDLPCE